MNLDLQQSIKMVHEEEKGEIKEEDSSYSDDTSWRRD